VDVGPLLDVIGEMEVRVVDDVAGRRSSHLLACRNRPAEPEADSDGERTFVRAS